MFGIICILISQLQGFFAKSYGTSRENGCGSVIQTQDQGYAMAGYSGALLSNGNFLVIKTDSTGTPIWAYEYYRTGGTYDEFAWSIVQASDGGYYVSGHGYDDMSMYNDIVLLKLNSSGAVQWAKGYGNSYKDFAHTMSMLSDGGLVIVGYSLVDPFTTGENLIVVKMTPDGNVIWAKQYADVYQDLAYGVIQASDGSIVAVGATQRSGASDKDILLIRLDGFGNTLWAKAYGISGSGEGELGLSVAQLNDGDLVVVGECGSYGAGILKIRLSDGALLWARTLPTVDVDYHYLRAQITKTSDGGFLIPGYTNDFIILKLNSAGGIQWAKGFGGSSGEEAICAIQKPDGRFAIAGMTQSYGAGGNDVALLILRSDGTFPGACVYDYSPTMSSPTFSTYTLSALTDWPYTTTSLSYDRMNPGLTITSICNPVHETEDEHHSGSNARIIARPCQGGASFLSPEPTSIKIYLADGRLAYSGMLQKGDNRIELDQGVYFWRAGKHSGIVTVR